MTLDKKQQSAIIGHMLGDGCLYKPTPNSNAAFILNRKTEDKSYLDWSYSILREYCNNGVKYKNWFDDRESFNKRYEQYYFYTQYREEFTIIYDNWYNNKVKIIPKDFDEDNLDSLTLAVWFMDDGTCYYKPKYPKSLQIRLYTNGFSKDEVVKLQQILSIRLGEYFTIGSDKKHKNQYIILGSDSAARKYFHEIDGYVSSILPRKCRWRDSCCEFNSKIAKSKSRNVFILENEFNILQSFFMYKKLTIPQISEMCSWKRNSLYNKVPTKSIMRYLNKYIENGLIIKTDKFLFHKGRVFAITSLGEDYFKCNLKNKSLETLLFSYIPIAKTKHGPK